MSYLHGSGKNAFAVVPLTWGVIAISVLVVIIVTALVVAGILLRRTRQSLPVGVHVQLPAK